MKTLTWVLAACFALVSVATIAAETAGKVPLDKLEPPAPGKAAVYLFLPGKAPVIPSISLFDGEKQLPNLLGAHEYARYEVEPGLHTFTVQGVVPGFVDSGQWVHGDLEAGGIYAALISGFMADLVVKPLTGRLDPDLLVNMKLEAKQWERVAGLLDAKPPKPPGKERKHTLNMDLVAGSEVISPNSGFSNLVRLNPTAPHPDLFPFDRLPEPVPGKSLIVVFVPQRPEDDPVRLFDGDHHVEPVLTGGAYYTYETTPGPKTLWVREVGTAYTVYRLVTGNLEAGRVYGVVAYRSFGAAGARLFSLSGDAANRVYFIPEAELWSEIEALWDSPGGSLERTEPVAKSRMKAVGKKIAKKAKKKRRSEFIPLNPVTK